MKRRSFHYLPAPFAHIRIDVTPMRRMGQPDDVTVGVMNILSNQGRRGDVSLAEAEAKAVLRAIRSYRRANPDPEDLWCTVCDRGAEGCTHPIDEVSA